MCCAQYGADAYCIEKLYRKINLSEVPVFKSSEGFARLRISAEKKRLHGAAV